ncbi:hypothetical protein MalM25_37870 [Planctomycetes bacterium MalM25]|nr:hypothetical protein MalM25_37870 [Planctomycetes bacterium MalM25]
MPKEGDTGAKLTSGELTLEFIWRGDRFEHVIQRGEDSLASASAPGIETPVYQEVHQQGELVFASGMSGDRHWSASVEPIENGFVFDVACRIKSNVERLGVAYEGDGPLEAAPTDGSELTNPTQGKHLITAPSPSRDLPRTLRCCYRINGGIIR